MSESGSLDRDTPPLFEGLEDEVEDVGAGRSANEERASGLEKLVTRVPPRQGSWAMKWRPGAGEDPEAGRRHLAGRSEPPPASEGTNDATRGDSPLRIVDPSVDAPPHPADQVDTTVDAVTEPKDVDVVTEPTAVDAVTEPEDVDDVTEPEAVDDVAPETVPVVHDDASVEHRGSTDMGRVEPEPSLEFSTAAASPSVVDAESGATGRQVMQAAGWLVALATVMAWVIWGEPGPATAVGDADVASGPASDVSSLAVEEVAVLRADRERLQAEVDAALVLVEDHRRLVAALEDATRRDEAATLESERLQANLRELENALGVANAREADLLQEIGFLRRQGERLDDVGGSD